MYGLNVSDDNPLAQNLHSLHFLSAPQTIFAPRSSASFQMSRVVRKPVFVISDQVQHKLGCATTEDDLRLKISDLASRWIVLSE